MSTSAKDCPAGENLETQRSRLFVSLKRRINRTLKFAQEIESKEHSQESRLGSKERAQAEVVSGQFVFEFVNPALHARSPVVIAPDIQCGFTPIGDKNPKDVAGQINELAANGRLVGLEFFAHHHKAPLGLPVPKFKVKFSDAVNPIDGLPLSDLIEAALEVTGKPRHHDVRQNAFFQKAEELVGIKA